MSTALFVTMGEEMPIWNIAYGKGEELEIAIKDGIGKWFEGVKKFIKDQKLPKSIKNIKDIVAICPLLRDMDFSLMYGEDNYEYPLLDTLQPNIVFTEMIEFTPSGTFPITLRSPISSDSLQISKLPQPEQLRTGSYLILLRPLFWEKHYKELGRIFNALLENNEDFNLAHTLYAMYELLGRFSTSVEFRNAIKVFDIIRDKETIKAYGIVKRGKNFSFVDLYTSIKPISPYPIRFTTRKLPIAQGKVFVDYLKTLIATDNPYDFITKLFGIEFPKVTEEVVEQARNLIKNIG